MLLLQKKKRKKQCFFLLPLADGKSSAVQSFFSNHFVYLQQTLWVELPGRDYLSTPDCFMGNVAVSLDFVSRHFLFTAKSMCSSLRPIRWGLKDAERCWRWNSQPIYVHPVIRSHVSRCTKTESLKKKVRKKYTWWFWGVSLWVNQTCSSSSILLLALSSLS